MIGKQSPDMGGVPQWGRQMFQPRPMPQQMFPVRTPAPPIIQGIDHGWAMQNPPAMWGGGQGGEGAGPNGNGGQMGSAGQRGTFGKEAADALTGLALGGVGLLGAGSLGSAAAHGFLGDAFGPASLHNADINPSAYGIDASGYGPADFGGNSGGYGAGADAAGGGYGSDAGGHAGQGSAEGGFSRGGLVRGAGGPRQDNIPIHASVGEGVLNNPAMRALGPQNFQIMNAIGNMRSSDAMKHIAMKLALQSLSRA